VDYQNKGDPSGQQGRRREFGRRVRFFQSISAVPRIVTRNRHTIVRQTRYTAKRVVDQRARISTGCLFYRPQKTWVEETSPLPSIRAAPQFRLAETGFPRKRLVIEHDRTRHDRKPRCPCSAAKTPRRFPASVRTIHCEPMHRSLFASGRISGRRTGVQIGFSFGRQSRARQSAVPVGLPQCLAGRHGRRAVNVLRNTIPSWIRMSFPVVNHRQLPGTDTVLQRQLAMPNDLAAFSPTQNVPNVPKMTENEFHRQSPGRRRNREFVA